MSAGADVIRHHKVAPPHMSVVNRLSMVRHKSRQPMEPQQGESKYANNNNLMEIVLEKLGTIGLEKKKFGLHSLRAVGATRAAKEGVPDRLFKRHGRWKSERSKDSYVKDDIKTRLRVSLSLGL